MASVPTTHSYHTQLSQALYIIYAVNHYCPLTKKENLTLANM